MRLRYILEECTKMSLLSLYLGIPGMSVDEIPEPSAPRERKEFPLGLATDDMKKLNALYLRQKDILRQWQRNHHPLRAVPREVELASRRLEDIGRALFDLIEETFEVEVGENAFGFRQGWQVVMTPRTNELDELKQGLESLLSHAMSGIDLGIETFECLTGEIPAEKPSCRSFHICGACKGNKPRTESSAQQKKPTSEPGSEPAPVAVQEEGAKEETVSTEEPVAAK